jgi:hypothetical protein
MSAAVEYALLFAASAAFEFSYVAWARAASRDAVVKTTAYSVATAALGLLGIRGAIELVHGWVPYLGGIGFGACVSAWLGQRALLSKHTSAVAP